MSDILNVVVRIMPSGDELDVELPVQATGKMIIGELLDASVAPRVDGEGNPYVYELISKMSNTRISDDKTLEELGIREGETLFLVPKLVAG